MRRTVIGSLLGAIAALVVGGTPAIASGPYSLYGQATLTSGYNSPTGVELTSVGAIPASSSSYSGIDFAVPNGLTFQNVSDLATEYDFTHNDCGGGSPRFQLNVTYNGQPENIFIYIGPAPSFTGCSTGVWTNTGNLASSPDAIVDTTQLVQGPYQTFSDAKADFGSLAITGIQLVADGGWAFDSGVGTQTVVVDNVVINGTTYTFESASTCKDSGWEAYASSPGPFKNQGDCVSYFATGGTNTAAG